MTLTLITKATILTIEKLQGDLKEEYGRLQDYLDEIERSNPESATQLKVNRPIPESLPFFERFFISFYYLKRVFLGGHRKIIGFDGRFLKGPIKGEILPIVGDGNYQMFPMAWSVVTCENKVTWSWFIELLAMNLDLKDGFGWTIIIDQQKVLNSSITHFHFLLQCMIR